MVRYNEEEVGARRVTFDIPGKLYDQFTALVYEEGSSLQKAMRVLVKKYVDDTLDDQLRESTKR